MSQNNRNRRQMLPPGPQAAFGLEKRLLDVKVLDLSKEAAQVVCREAGLEAMRHFGRMNGQFSKQDGALVKWAIRLRTFPRDRFLLDNGYIGWIESRENAAQRIVAFCATADPGRLTEIVDEFIEVELISESFREVIFPKEKTKKKAAA